MNRLDINMKVLIAIMAFFGLSLSVMAQPPQRLHQFHQRDQGGFAMLNLTEDQKAEVKEIHLARMKEIQPLKDELRINRAKLNALMNKDNPDMKEIVSLIEANGMILTNIQVKRIESKMKVRALLTDEQKVICDARVSKPYRKRVIARQHMDRMGQMDRITPGKYRF